jgi:excisionase family DNA binding protein
MLPDALLRKLPWQRLRSQRKGATMLKKKRALRAKTSAPAWPRAGENQPISGGVISKLTPAADAALPIEGYVTVAEAAVLLRVCPKTVRNRIKSGELVAFRHGRRILIPLTAIEGLIRRERA